jgi:hypothetical protein
MLSSPLRLLCAAVCVAVAPAAARAKEPPRPSRLALVLYEKGSPDRGLVRDFLSTLAAIDARADSISIIGDRELDDRLGPTHIDEVVACGADLRCVAAIGARAGATHVLFGRATGQAGNVSMQWLLVGVGTAGIVGKLRVELQDAGDPAAMATRLAREVLGLPAADPSEPQGRPPGAPTRPTVATAPAAPAPPAGPRSSWSAPGVAGAAVLACGALTLGAGVLSSRGDGEHVNALLGAGGLLVMGGAAVWGWDWLRVSPVVAIDGKQRYAGVSVAW